MADFFKSLESQTVRNPAAIGSLSSSAAIRILLVVIVLILIIGCVVYWFVFRKKPRYAEAKGPYVLGPMNMPNRPKPVEKWTSLIPADKLANVQSNNFTCSFFLYIDDANRERIPINNAGYNFQYILSIGNAIGVTIDPIRQTMRVTMVMQPVMGATSTKEPIPLIPIDIENVMIAKWNQIAISIEGRTIDIYLNGKLVKSKLMDNLPWSQMGNLALNNSPDFTGQAALFQVWPTRRTMNQIMENYKRNTDPRGKPLVPDVRSKPTLRDALRLFRDQLCNTTGFCGFSLLIKDLDPLHYVEYEFA